MKSHLTRIGLPCTGATLLVLGIAASTPAAVLINETFEGVGGVDADGFQTFAPGVLPGTAFTVETGSVDILGPDFELPAGEVVVSGQGQYLDTSGNNRSILSSTDSFSFDVGDVIDLSFTLIGYNDSSRFGDSARVLVSLGDLFEEQFTIGALSVPINFSRQIDVSSAATDVKLTFSTLNSDVDPDNVSRFVGPFLDDVSLKVTDVPEPSVLLPLLGLGVIAGYKRLQKASQHAG